MAINFRSALSDPYAVDTGNKTTQSLTVSKTIKFGLFTNNANAVWGAKQQLQKESYPFAVISVPVNRDLFRLQVGDTFKFSYSKYSIVDMVCRVLQIEEESLESENIIVHAMEDVFSVTNVTESYSAPIDNTGDSPDYTAVPIVNQDVIEAPFVVVGDDIGVIPIVSRSASSQTGYTLYMSSDDGASYSPLGSFGVFAVYGATVREYTTDTYQIDDVGMIVDFANDDIDFYESLTRQGMLGIENTVLIGSEIMTLQTITPITGGSGRRYKLTGVYRARFGTVKENHAVGSGMYLINGKQFAYSLNEDILPGTDRKFKVTPFNIQTTGTVADSLVTDLSIVGVSRTPYPIPNLRANGNNTDPVYYDDIVLTWTALYRSIGAGAYAPDITDKPPTWEGYYEIKVYVSDVLVRTTTDIDDDTWTYTEAMNTTDNGSLASEVVFKITNNIDAESGDVGSAISEITVRRGQNG